VVHGTTTEKMEGGGRPVDGDKTRDFVFVKMKQKDVDFMKSSIQHLRQQASLGTHLLPLVCQLIGVGDC
jgi:hypothetical protein